jgi:DNA invertase Pin-like site-specific DNA recombinase
MTRAYLYSRISTTDGRQNLARQKNELRTFAREANWKVVGIVDDCVSGASRKRPGLDAVMSAAADRKMDVLCVTEISRLSRAGVLDVFDLIDRLRKSGVDFWSVTEPHLRTTGPFGEIFLAVAAAIAKIERENLVTRVKSGMQAARNAGKRLGPPIKLVDKQRIFDMQAQGYSLRSIADELKVSHHTVQRRIRERDAAK